MKFETYSHHGNTVWVNSDLKGKHRDFCLCFQCEIFKKDSIEKCKIADDVFQVCIKHHLTTPVFECPNFSILKNVKN